MAQQPEIIDLTQELPQPPRFEVNCQTLFLTWPRNATEPKLVLQRMVDAWRSELEFALVAREKHRVETPVTQFHLHAVMRFKCRKHFRNSDILDALAGRHGNYQPARSVKKVLEYVCKDKDWVSFPEGFDPVVAPAIAGGKFDQAAKSLIAGQTLLELNKEMPGFVLQHKRKLEEYQALVNPPRLPKATWIGCSIDLGIHPTKDPEFIKAATDLGFWMNGNLCVPRGVRASQLWIQGESGVGKSTLLDKLAERMRVYIIPCDGWYDEYDDDAFDLLVLDEFCGQLPVYMLNKLADGTHMMLPRRNRPPYLKKKPLPLIICSNLSPRDVYHKINDSQLAAVTSRFTHVYFRSMFYYHVAIIPVRPEDPESGDDSDLSDPDDLTSPVFQ